MIWQIWGFPVLEIHQTDLFGKTPDVKDIRWPQDGEACFFWKVTHPAMHIHIRTPPAHIPGKKEEEEKQ